MTVLQVEVKYLGLFVVNESAPEDPSWELFFIILSGVRLSPLGTAATTGLLYQPQMIDDGDCGAVGGMKIGRGNRSTRRKPAPMPATNRWEQQAQSQL
jgi:hypothetical protein